MPRADNSGSLLIPQRLHGFEPPSPPGRDKPAQDTHDPRTPADEHDVSRNDDRGELSEAIDRSRKKLETRHAVHEMQELVTIGQREHSQAQSGRYAYRPD